MSKAAGAPKTATMDSWRIGIALFGSFLQVIVGFFVPVGSLVNRQVSLIIPAGWTFAIWGPIFLLCFIFAGYQLLPSKRYDPLLRSVGWPLGLAFVGNGLWTLIQPLKQPILSQVVILLILILALTALFRLARFGRRGEVSAVQRWVVGLPTGSLAGWLTAANVVGFNDMLVREDVVGSGVLAALVGAGLLVVGAAVAALVILVGAGGPVQASIAYAAAVLWGLFGIAANQYDSSLITTFASFVCSVALIVVCIRALAGSRSGGTPRARVV